MWIIIASLIWLAWALLAHAIRRNPRGDTDAGIAMLFIHAYLRVVHRLRVTGRANIARALATRRPIAVVANHTAGIDPILIQSCVPIEVRFMMARDMQHPAAEAMWRWTRVITVDRKEPDSRAAREAIRHLKAGGRDGGPGIVGIFPEGGIERPPRTLLPFEPGVGLLVHKAGAIVLPIVISDTPHTKTAWGSFLRSSRSRLTVLEPIDYSVGPLRSAEITADLQQRFAHATGWPMASSRTDRVVPKDPSAPSSHPVMTN
jgi:1-acyl-sn-glycerol-3-phosphate acyltransferase